MGPLATGDLFMEIVTNTLAATDSEHLRILVDNNTAIPDRTDAILHNGPSPLNEMQKSAQRLMNMGANVLCMPCNTAHYFYKDLASRCGVPFVNMIEETGNELMRQGIKKAALLATEGTVLSGIYADVMRNKGVELLYPDARAQRVVTDVIYKGIKANNMAYNPVMFNAVIETLFAHGAQTLILGCTELPIAARRFGVTKPCVNPTHVLARAVITAAGGKLK
jgi:aspartate racemase